MVCLTAGDRDKSGWLRSGYALDGASVMPDLAQYLTRILYALRFRIGRIYEVPPLHEIEFIRMTGNHREFSAKLEALGQHETSQSIKRYANHVGLSWLRLSLEHLEDARISLVSARSHTAYSRSYYAAYNASKAVRYIVNGVVSLKGHDHPRASSDLPDDFPDVDRWSQVVTDLYEHRLRADYDNWVSTSAENSLSADDAFRLANQFVDRCRSYLSRRLGITI
jgi:uncharacterized protein (UPF0332 family)